MTPPPLSCMAVVSVALVASACATSSPAPPAADGDSPDPAPTAETESAPARDAPSPRIVQPGAPGQATRTVEATRLSEMGGVAWVEADVQFMQGMIPHHAQALEMTALASEHAGPAVQRLALRMEISQRDEIALMSRWLRDRGQHVPEGHAHHGSMEGMMMPGMLTAEQMDDLRNARGADFDRLFLEYMIQHHQGAIVMVDTLFSTDGAGQESEIFQLASHVDADQRAEIARMRWMLESY